MVVVDISRTVFLSALNTTNHCALSMHVSTTGESAMQSSEYTSRHRSSRLTKTLICATLTACLGAVSFGYVLEYASPVHKDLKEKLNWNSEHVTWFNSIPALGAMVGSLIGLYTIDRFGRKFNIIMSSVPFVAGWTMVAGAKVTSLFYIGRFMTGVGLGAISFAVPVYVAEISPARYRGALESVLHIGINLGGFLAYSLGAGLNWHWLAIAAAVPITFMAILMLAFPETPRWLVKNGRIDEACQALVFFRKASLKQCEDECEEIQRTLETDERISLRDFTKPTIYRPLIISMMLLFFHQFSGTNAVMTYASTMLRDAGISNANVAEIAIVAVRLTGTGISCLIVDKVGRRILVIIPAAVMCASMAVLGASRYCDGFPPSITLISLCCFIFGFALGIGPMAWLIMSEIFSTQVRGVASGMAVLVNWLCCFIVIKFYGHMETSMHSYGTYWFFAAVCFACMIYAFVFLPETKGKTLEEMEELFANHSYLRGTDSLRKGYERINP